MAINIKGMNLRKNNEAAQAMQQLARQAEMESPQGTTVLNRVSISVWYNHKHAEL